LIEKGSTKVALYGLGSVRDERLHRLFLANKVKWARPAENAEEWFSIFVIHQNRTKHSAAYKNSISESMLPKFLDLVIWAHEHESLMELQEFPSQGFYVSQPGSTCRTSLCLGEAGLKYFLIYFYISIVIGELEFSAFVGMMCLWIPLI